MGHDIFGYNKAGKEIAYARFSMGNPNAIVLYELLNAMDYYAGVSGSGDFMTFSKQQMGSTLEAYKKRYDNNYLNLSKSDYKNWDRKQISDFLVKCTETAKKEESVKVYFG